MPLAPVFLSLSAHVRISRERIIQGFFIPFGVVFVHFTSSPLYSRPKKTVLYSIQKYALSWKVLERSANFGADLGFALLQNSQSGQFGFFSPFSHSPLLAEILERSRNSQNRCLPSRPDFSQSRRS